MSETLSPARRPASFAPVARLPHSGMNVAEFHSMHFLGAVFPLTAGLLLFGWRALAVIGIVCASACVAVLVWRHIGARGPQLRIPQTLWLATLLALMLPAHLATSRPDDHGETPWVVLPAIAFVLVIMMWLLGGLGAGRIHPVIVSYLLLIALFADMLVPQYVLRRDRMFFGDLLRGAWSDARVPRNGPWVSRPHEQLRANDADSERGAAPASILARYTTGREAPPRGWLPLQGLLRDGMPPLEDLIVGGQPGPIGTSSALAVIIGGLFLLYRGLIDYRIPLFLFLAEYAALLLLPIPTVIAARSQWHWAAMRQPDVGWAAAVTFANYELMAGPSLFVAFFLATAPALRPMARRARMIYAVIAGVLCAVAQLYMSVSFGPYVALLVASLLTPAMDWWFRPRPLV